MHEIQAYINYIESVRVLSPHSCSAYKQDLTHFAEWLNGKNILDCTNNDIRMYLLHLGKQGLDGKSINRSLSALKTFYQYWSRKLDKDYSNILSTKSIKTKTKLPEFFFEADIERMLDELKCASTNFISARNYTIMELLYSTGCRVSEIQGICLSDIDWKQNSIRVLAKGKKIRTVFLNSASREALVQYLKQREIFLHKDNTNAELRRIQNLLLNNNKKPLSIRGIQYILQEYGTKVGEHIHPHKFRHSFATHFMNAGANLRNIQEFLGHETLSTTQKYTHTSLGRLKDVYRNAHPHSRRSKKLETL